MRNSVERFGLVAMLAVLLCVDFCTAVSLPLVRTFATPGQMPDGITFVGDDLWIWDIEDDDKFYVVNPSNGSLLHTYSAPHTGGATSLAYDGQYVWGTEGGVPGDEMFAKFNPSDGTVIGNYTIPIPRPTGITFDGSNLWISQIGNRLVRIDPVTLEITAEIQKSPYDSYGLAWDGNSLWLAWHQSRGEGRGMDYYLSKINPSDGSVLATYDGPPGGPIGMDIRNNQLYVASGYDAQIYVYQIPEPVSVAFATVSFILLGGQRTLFSSRRRSHTRKDKSCLCS